jgi:hypothetical protein
VPARDTERRSRASTLQPEQRHLVLPAHSIIGDVPRLRSPDLTALFRTASFRHVSRRVFTAVAWLLVALWLPAVLHCAAQTAGVFEVSECCAGDLSAAASDTQDEVDHCEVIESGAPREDEGSQLAVQPALVALQILRVPLCLLAASRDVGVSPAEAAPPEILPRWRVVERVVALAQAP